MAKTPFRQLSSLWTPAMPGETVLSPEAWAYISHLAFGEEVKADGAPPGFTKILKLDTKKHTSSRAGFCAVRNYGATNADEQVPLSDNSVFDLPLGLAHSSEARVLSR